MQQLAILFKVSACGSQMYCRIFLVFLPARVEKLTCQDIVVVRNPEVFWPTKRADLYTIEWWQVLIVDPALQGETLWKSGTHFGQFPIVKYD